MGDQNFDIHEIEREQVAMMATMVIRDLSELCPMTISTRLQENEIISL